MKRLLIASALSLAGVGLTAGTASAGLFSHWCNRCCDATTICVRAYNAFSPTCFGTITANGCLPLAGGGGYGDIGAVTDGACYGGGCAVAPHAAGLIQHPVAVVPGAQAPAPYAAPAYPPPAPMPANAAAPQPAAYRGWYHPAYGNPYGYPMPYAPVGYQPQYAPAGYQPYWNGYGR